MTETLQNRHRIIASQTSMAKFTAGQACDSSAVLLRGPIRKQHDLLKLMDMSIAIHDHVHMRAVLLF